MWKKIERRAAYEARRNLSLKSGTLSAAHLESGQFLTVLSRFDTVCEFGEPD
jgi:hypothetical protein